ncbi:hypothetical protein SAMN04487969_10575 [Paenibacillus algorifonticola]|uniref:Uncharacterized protein n=1 Tax=Paenibacillus algorifonticola TaxID=684063 RepID=A0A1I2CH49_9BACL|nr:hypothetical protein [Paenibacillus algorifonticola]SFE67651.1 hypothetical protein SAMN04487969_10575 [Paenibacillus algorifonticola]
MKIRLSNKLILAVPVAIVVLMFLLVAINQAPNTTDIMNQNIIKLKNETHPTAFSAITPFIWDKAFILEDPYYNGETIDEIVGATTHLNRIETEMKRRIVFVHQGEFVFDYIYNIREFAFRPFGTLELTTSSTIQVENETPSALVLQIEP